MLCTPPRNFPFTHKTFLSKHSTAVKYYKMGVKTISKKKKTIYILCFYMFCEACLGDSGIPAIVEAENRSKLEQQLWTYCRITMDSSHKTDLGFGRLRHLQMACDLKGPDSSELRALTQTDPRRKKSDVVKLQMSLFESSLLSNSIH